MKKMRIFNTVIIILFTLSINVIANEISGAASITDGDTIKILNKRIRFHGIDAPEKKQICIKNSKEYSCGKEAANELKRKIGSKSVTCKVQNKLDSYKRYIGVCFLENVDLYQVAVKAL